MARFKIHCSCGAALVVGAAQAGSRVACDCGRTINVPRLGALRSQAGLPSLASSPVRKIQELLAEDKLPSVGCVACGVSAAPILKLQAECESRMITKSGGFHWGLFLLTAALPVTALAWTRETLSSHGRDTIVPVPISLCRPCERELPRLDPWISEPLLYLLLGGAILLFFLYPDFPYYAIGLAGIYLLLCFLLAVIRNWQQKRWKSLLSGVDVYRELLDEFPDATIHGPTRRGTN